MAPTRFPAEDVDPSPLAQPLKFEFSGKTAPNRFLKGAMTERLSTWDPETVENRGVPTKELINVYRRWGEGGFGVILTGNVLVSYKDLEAAGNAIIPPGAPFEGERFEGFKAMAEASKKDGALVHAQLSHPGRQVPANIQPSPISASDVQLQENSLGMQFAKPRAMTEDDIKDVVNRFAHAAEYTYKAGFDGVQLHGAHGYLLAQFLSPTTNKRTDRYGGSLANRARIILEIADAIRARVTDPSFSIGIKVNSVEFQEGGFSTDDCSELCAALEDKGFDFVELSGGTYQELAFEHKRESSKKREAFFLEFAEQIIPRLNKTKVYVTGGLRTTAAMVKAVQTVHGVGLARPVCNEFDLPKKMINGEVNSSIQTLFGEQSFGLTNVLAGTQMRLVGKDKEPLDVSQEKYKEVFEKSMEKWSAKMADNSDNSEYGFIDVEGVKLEPFGTPYADAGEADYLPYPATKLIIGQYWYLSRENPFWGCLIVGTFYDQHNNIVWSTEIFAYKPFPGANSRRDDSAVTPHRQTHTSKTETLPTPAIKTSTPGAHLPLGRATSGLPTSTPEPATGSTPGNLSTLLQATSNSQPPTMAHPVLGPDEDQRGPPWGPHPPLPIPRPGEAFVPNAGMFGGYGYAGNVGCYPQYPFYSYNQISASYPWPTNMQVAPPGGYTTCPLQPAAAAAAAAWQVRGPQVPPALDPRNPAVQLNNSTGGTGCEPGYNYFFPAAHTKLHVFRSSEAPWQLPANANIQFAAFHVPVNTRFAEILKGFGATNPNPKKNKVFEIVSNGNGKWYKGLCFAGDDKDAMKQTIGEVGWDETRTGQPHEKPVVCIWVVKD
ncbi:NADH-dependent flavin oxidoreductase nadA [Colletotrichum trifolii]|uniref:NADH-dependent flavin oxidoreductase nadA n=1 Tax=Colletotrichum trifolii TaxID=5466 RepID=A0A4R8RGQ2_COLTR|nr:NADH-dependent flavin oxidoreductase nadA [Colletotrichum trifolii]